MIAVASKPHPRDLVERIVNLNFEDLRRLGELVRKIQGKSKLSELERLELHRILKKILTSIYTSSKFYDLLLLAARAQQISYTGQHSKLSLTVNTRSIPESFIRKVLDDYLSIIFNNVVSSGIEKDSNQRVSAVIHGFSRGVPSQLKLKCEVRNISSNEAWAVLVLHHLARSFELTLRVSANISKPPTERARRGRRDELTIPLVSTTRELLEEMRRVDTYFSKIMQHIEKKTKLRSFIFYSTLSVLGLVDELFTKYRYLLLEKSLRSKQVSSGNEADRYRFVHNNLSVEIRSRSYYIEHSRRVVGARFSELDVDLPQKSLPVLRVFNELSFKRFYYSPKLTMGLTNLSILNYYLRIIRELENPKLVRIVRDNLVSVIFYGDRVKNGAGKLEMTVYKSQDEQYIVMNTSMNPTPMLLVNIKLVGNSDALKLLKP